MKFRFPLITSAKSSFCFNLIIIFIISLYAFLKITKHFFLILRINWVHSGASGSLIRHWCVVLDHECWWVDNRLTFQILNLSPIVSIRILVAFTVLYYQMTFAETTDGLTAIFTPILDSQSFNNGAWDCGLPTIWNAPSNGCWVWNILTISTHIWWIHCGTGIVLLATLSSFSSSLIWDLLSCGIARCARGLRDCLSLTRKHALSRFVIILGQLQRWLPIVLICL